MLPLRTTPLGPTPLAVLWRDRYWRKNDDDKHKPEDTRLCQLAFTQFGVRDIVDKFLGYQRRFLDPPDAIRYAKLKDFLLRAKVHTLAPSSTHAEKNNFA